MSFIIAANNYFGPLWKEQGSEGPIWIEPPKATQPKVQYYVDKYKKFFTTFLNLNLTNSELTQYIAR